MDQWQPYSDSPGGQRRYNNNNNGNGSSSSSNNNTGQHQQARDHNGNAPSQPPTGFTYDQYQGGMGSHPQSMATSPAGTPQMRDGNGDVPMHDAGEAYGTTKYAMRPHHQTHLSAGRITSLQQSQEPSAAAQRYSPMDALPPTSPYAASPQNSQKQYGSQAAGHQQSPTRPGTYSSPGSYYGSRQYAQHLPPITPFSSNDGTESYPPSATTQLHAVFGNDPKSPRRQAAPPSQGSAGRGPVPQFGKLNSISDLQPNINPQPAFRRANPEGGFISVSQPQRMTVCRLI